MTRYLIATWSGGGNVPPVLAIAHELRRRGDSVRIIGHDDQRSIIEAQGLPFEQYPTGRQWVGSTGSNPVAMFRVFHDLALGDDVVASITREPIDAVIVDCMLLGVLARVQSAGVPTFVIAHTVMSYWHSWRRNPLTVLMSARGGFRAEQLWNAASRVLVTALPELDSASHHDARYAWTGPVVPREAASSAGDAVLGHGGHGTTMTALAHDLPVVALPLHPMIDQPIVAAAVERAGAGIALSKRARPATIAAAVQRALDDPAYRAAAARLGATIRDRNAASTAVDEMTQALSRTA